MAILNFSQLQIGVVGVTPSVWFLTSNDSYADITTAGYWKNNSSTPNQIASGDFVFCLYGTASNTPALLVASVSSSTGVVTFVAPLNGIVDLPVVDGDFATFDGTSGKIDDSGYSPTDATKTKVVMMNGAGVAGSVAGFADTAGTIENIGTIYSGVTDSWAGGGTSHTFTAAGLTPADVVIASIGAQAGTAYIVEFEPLNNTLAVTFSADPGLVFVNYIAFRPVS